MSQFTQANAQYPVGGNPNPDRTWTECFAQLVGTVLSLWDAAELDAAGEEGEVLPKFINLTDASIKMVSQHQKCLLLSLSGTDAYLSVSPAADRIIADEVKRRAAAAEYPEHKHGGPQPIPVTFQLPPLAHPMDGRHQAGHVRALDPAGGLHWSSDCRKGQVTEQHQPDYGSGPV